MRTNQLTSCDDKAGQVYLMQSGTWFKIGSGFDPEDRLTAFQTGNPDIRIVCDWECPRHGELEERVRQFYSSKGYKHPERREWFSLPPEAVAFLCRLDDIGFWRFAESPESWDAACDAKLTARAGKYCMVHFAGDVIFEGVFVGRRPTREEIAAAVQSNPTAFRAYIFIPYIGFVVSEMSVLLSGAHRVRLPGFPKS